MQIKSEKQFFAAAAKRSVKVEGEGEKVVMVFFHNPPVGRGNVGWREEMGPHLLTWPTRPNHAAPGMHLVNQVDHSIIPGSMRLIQVDQQLESTITEI